MRYAWPAFRLPLRAAGAARAQTPIGDPDDDDWDDDDPVDAPDEDDDEEEEPLQLGRHSTDDCCAAPSRRPGAIA